jgi:phosphoribosylformylglycinamidine synthase
VPTGCGLAKTQEKMHVFMKAVEAASNFACALGINIPTGKDSCSMTQKYKDDVVYSPGTVIITASGEVTDIRKVVEPVLVQDKPFITLIYRKRPRY